MVAWSLLWACSSGPTYEADVRPILEGRCTGCHFDGGIGGFSLDGYDAARAQGPLVAEATAARTMPPWKAVPGVRDYERDPSLTDEQIQVIADWVDGGMREGDPEDRGEPLAALAVALPRTDTTLEMPLAYEPTGSTDDYRCFLLDWQPTGSSFVTGFEVHPDNLAIVHHVAAFLLRPDGLLGPDLFTTFEAYEDVDPEPGWSCFGGPSLTGDDADVPISQLAQWVPGSGATLFPEGVGIEVPEGSKVVLQVHYHLVPGAGTDRTTVDVMVEPDVERVGAYAPWLDASWPIGGMVIPPHSDAVSHVADGDPLPFFDLLLGDAIDLSGGFDIHSVMMHMHTLGAGGSVAVRHQDGTREELLHIEDWDFEWQFDYRFETPAHFLPGDEMSLECLFDNHQDGAVLWGEGTDEEMCVANLFVSAPR
ncbi:MAG: monooxygenase [Alphaproteobacteria bacterium]|nr:monooxygenase [Alphaproteobacteria bacterium]MCB9699067.1 monooxygenase [Alphaproteobacteria bacterium]